MRFNNPAIIVAFGISLSAAHAARAADWLQYAGNAERHAHAVNAPAELSANLWTAAMNSIGETIVYEGPSSPVVHDGRIFANARVLTGTTHTANKIVAIDMADGAVLFETPIMKSTLNSWSSPAVDVDHSTVLIGSGNTVYAIDSMAGGVVWSTSLTRSIVNASVAVAGDLKSGRAFITDYDGNGTSASLYCLNTSPFDLDINPFQPGRSLAGAHRRSSGNSPAYANGVVYVASVSALDSPGFPGDGQLYAFDVNGADGERLRWSVAVGDGFFGGVTVVDGFVYAASYDPFCGADNSVLVKVSATDGAVQWTIPCERTNSIPVVDGDRIYLSAGIPGFGSAPKVQAFADHGAFATKLWDTFADTGGALAVGGWTHQPVYSEGVLYCGRIATGNVFFGAYIEMFLLDVTRAPTEPEYVVDHVVGFGSTPAICDGRLYSIGPDGLHATAALGDVCSGHSTRGDGVVDGADVPCFVELMLTDSPSAAETAIGDFDGDEMLTMNDKALFVERLVGE
ncbi:MAG: PQQ-like beta-propeller repeat protein [Planctomycetes bacterium]|nr:PQQ-like beta-propeller repeat protein [Planctomycetota bacterium]